MLKPMHGWYLLLFYGLLVSGLVAADQGGAPGASAAPAPRRILTAADFVEHQYRRDDSLTPVTLWVQIHSNLPPYRFVLEPAAPRNAAKKEDVVVGKIKVFREGTAAPVQTIVVRGGNPDLFKTGFWMADVNFDGYLDLAALSSVGAKWRSDSYWVFDRSSGRFTTNRLTAQLGELMYDSIAVQPAKGEIRAALWIGVCRKSFEVYRIERGKLVRVESEIHDRTDAEHCTVTRQIRGGSKRVTQVKHPLK